MAPSTSTRLTPAMRQYMDAKKEIPEGAILLFRMGDFYELFFDDAKRAAPMMDVVLTSRGGVPMCGVPYHAVDMYVRRLIEAGVKVAIAEQLEDPKQAKGLVKRGVTRVITPGTVLDESVLSSSRGNFLVAVCQGRTGYGLSLLDVSTGDFRATELIDQAALEIELHGLQPAECLVADTLHAHFEANGFPDTPEGLMWTPIEPWLFDGEVATDYLCRHFDVASLDGYGCRGLPAAVGAAGAVLHYTSTNLRREADHVTSLRVYQSDACMVLDRITQRNLELVEPLFSDSRGSTLMSVLNQTETPMGTRLLREWILRPLRSVDQINRRLDLVQAFAEDQLLLAELREVLGAVRDLERTLTRLNVGSANARDLLVLQVGLDVVPALRALLTDLELDLAGELLDDLQELPDLTRAIEQAVVDEPPATISNGGIFRDGYNDQLDEFRRASTDGKSWIAALQTREQDRTGIRSLKVRFNKVFGYFIEVTKPNLPMVPENYTRKQTLTNAERFICPELKEVEAKVLGAEEKAKALENELFHQLREQVVAATPSIQRIARAVARLDVIASLAHVAVNNRYCRPVLADDTILEIRDGRHPVLDRLMTDDGFVPNDVILDTAENQLAVITGPNMAGKSTYIRQVALLVIMAQAGSFVPARSARVGLVDRVFTRVGAADDLARGQSTFMVEMVETANILNNATSHSLIVLDEIGRGTSTFDGLSLAWAVAEHIHDEESLRARTLFATHYHELTELALTRKGVRNYNVAVREHGEKVIFLRKILPGTADRSYGIHVARLAGLPRSVIKRAGEVLTNLETNAVSANGQPKLARSRRKGADSVQEAQLAFEF